jgi:hypothetical protein
MEQVLDSVNMNLAWDKVRASAGAPGIDGMTIEEFRGFVWQHWERLRSQLRAEEQWKQPRTRRRNLLRLGANPGTVHMATRSRKSYWRMSANSILHNALNNKRLKDMGVPELRDIWIKWHYGERSSRSP